jgi:hypothetical protein
MRRREFIKLLGGTITFRSIAARAQEAGRIIRLGFLVPNPRQVPAVDAVFDELRLNGFVEGQNLLVIPNGFEAVADNLDVRARALLDATPLFSIAGTHNNQVVMERVNAARLPAIFQWPETAEEAGAILAYGPRFSWMSFVSAHE